MRYIFNSLNWQSCFLFYEMLFCVTRILQVAFRVKVMTFSPKVPEEGGNRILQAVWECVNPSIREGIFSDYTMWKLYSSLVVIDSNTQRARGFGLVFEFVASCWWILVCIDTYKMLLEMKTIFSTNQALYYSKSLFTHCDSFCIFVKLLICLQQLNRMC